MPVGTMGARLTRTVTDAEGKSTLNKMGGNSVHVYYASGKFTMTAWSGDAKVTFHLAARDVAPPPPPVPGAVMKLISGDKQEGCERGRIPGGTAKFDPLVVRVIDASAKPIAGVKVTWVAQSPEGWHASRNHRVQAPTTTSTMPRANRP